MPDSAGGVLLGIKHENVLTLEEAQSARNDLEKLLSVGSEVRSKRSQESKKYEKAGEPSFHAASHYKSAVMEQKPLKNCLLSQTAENLRHWAPGMTPRLRRKSWLSGAEWYVHFPC